MLEVSVKYFNKIKHPNDKGVNVGWFEDQKYAGDLPIAQVAVWNEFGTKAGIPARPFMRTARMNNEKKWIETLKTLVQRALDEDKPIDTALKKFGEIVKGDIQETIISGGFKPNSYITVNGGWIRHKNGKPFYVQGKGKNTPLVDTGIMVSSIQSRIDGE